MDLFLLCLNAVLPLVFIIVIGYLSRRAGWIREEDIPRMNALVFRVFMPIMCFYNVCASDLSSALRPRLMLFVVLGVLAVYAASIVFAERFLPDRRQRGVMIQALYRSNFLIIGLSFTARMTGDDSLGVVSLLGAVIGVLFNVLAVVTLDYYRGDRPDPGKLLLDIIKNPLILGSAAGITCLLAGVRIPTPVELALRDMGRVASPAMLFLLGAFFRFDIDKSRRRELITACAGRLLVVPAAALPIAAAAGFRGVEFVTLIAVFGSSTAVASFTMAEQMGGDAVLAGDIVVVTSALCPLTLFLWSMVFGRLGLF